MSQQPSNNAEGQAGSDSAAGAPGGRLIANEPQRAKARKFFDHAKKAADTRNYDYAIRLYVDGLVFWPDAIEEGLKKLRVVGTARKLEGGKPLGFLAGRKYPVGGKDVLNSLRNALYLFGMEPASLNHMETILQLATKARCDRMVFWLAPVLADAYNSTKRLPAGRYAATCQAMDAAAELAMTVGEDENAEKILEAAITVTQIWLRHYPDSNEAQRARSDASGKLTIVKGRFSKATGFQDSLKDGEAQHDIRDQDRPVHTGDRQQQLVARARQEWAANPTVPAKLLHLIDLMIRIEQDDTENEAIALLEKQFAVSKDYAFKQKADDIRMRQMNRYRRALQDAVRTDPRNADVHRKLMEHVARQSEAEMVIYRDRVEYYPTDMRLRFQLALRFFALRRFDDAIPLFQQSQIDGKCRDESRLYLGRCFFEKKFFDQAVGTLRDAIESMESANNRTGLELNYWLGRALESADSPEEAKTIYGQLIQWDYNYRDARHRLQRIVARDSGAAGA
jgi:tetratricopeptide (TPR) repeat protein